MRYHTWQGFNTKDRIQYATKGAGSDFKVSWIKFYISYFYLFKNNQEDEYIVKVRHNFFEVGN